MPDIIVVRPSAPSQLPAAILSAMPAVLETAARMAQTYLQVKHLESDDRALDRQASLAQQNAAIEAERLITRMKCRSRREIAAIEAFGKITSAETKAAGRLARNGHPEVAAKIEKRIEGSWERLWKFLRRIGKAFKEDQP